MKYFQTSVQICFAVFFLAITSNLTAQDINSCYKVNKVAEKVWAIIESGGTPVNIYLVEGNDSALIIDTGYGNGDLKEYLRTLTQLPIIVVNTHGHGDHVGDDYQFAKIYAHPDDFGMINSNLQSRKNTMSSTNTKIESTILCPVKEGYIFNLGGRKIEVIEVPGHTHGSICLLDRDNKILFAGDNTNTIVWLFLKDCYPLEVYLKSLQKVEKLNKYYDKVMPGHNEPLEKTFISEQIACVKSILDGTCSPEPYDKSSFTAGAMLCNYKRSGVAYDPKNLFEKK